MLGATIGAAVAEVPKPQSLPGMTRSRPTISAKRRMRWAISSGCSMKLLVEVEDAGDQHLVVGDAIAFRSSHSCSWRGLAA